MSSDRALNYAAEVCHPQLGAFWQRIIGPQANKMNFQQALLISNAERGKLDNRVARFLPKMTNNQPAQPIIHIAPEINTGILVSTFLRENSAEAE